MTDPVGADVLDAAPDLKAIANMAVGTDNINVAAAAARGIAVGNTPDVLTDATADLAFALLLALARKIVPGAAKVRDGEWRTWEPAGDLGADLAGATLGIVGWGRIGQAVARRAEGFGMHLVHSSRSSGVQLGVLLERADFVSVHTPLTPETRHLIDAGALERMKPTALLVNTSRGGVVDQERLLVGVTRARIAGACSTLRTRSRCRRSWRVPGRAEPAASDVGSMCARAPGTAETGARACWRASTGG